MAATTLIAGSLIPARADYPSEVLALQPLTYWRFNDNVTVPAYDVATNLGSLGTVGDGRYYDTFIRPVSGAIAGDAAVAFSNPTLGTAYFGSMRVPNDPALNPSGPFSVEFWAKPSNNTAALLSPVNSMSFTTGRAGYLFYQNGATWQFRIGVTTSTTASLINGGTIVANQWQHVVGVYSGGASGTMTLFVDGVQVATGPATYEVNNNAGFYVGSTSIPNRTFDGAVDEVAFYNGTLSAAQVAAHFAARTTDPAGYATQILGDTPVAYWRLNEPVKTYPETANAGSLGAAANGTYRGATNTAGPAGAGFPGFEASHAALAGDGLAGHVAAPGLGLGGPLTMAAWVNPNIVSGDRAIAGENTSYAFKLNGSELRFTTPGIRDHTSAGASVQAGVWQHAAVTFAPGAVGGAQFYLNGQPVGSADASALTSATNAFWIGKNQWGQEFDGAIDEVAVFNRVLSGGTILSLFFTAMGSNAAPFMVSDPPVLSPSGTIYATTPFTLTADVAGSLPMVFQWRKDGANLPGATAATYSKASAGLVDVGSYDLVVTNSFGAVTSLTVSVTIDPAVPPTITSQPSPQQVYPGGTAIFTVVAEGTLPLSYQWKRAGANLPGATAARLVVTNCTAAETGAYAVNVTNVAGTRLSATANLTLRTPLAGSYEEKVAATRPVAYWRLGETSGTTAYDYAGGNNGTNSAEITLGAAGPATPLVPGFPADNVCYAFNANDSYVEAASLGLAGPISVSVWIKPNGLGGDRAIVGENTSWTFKLLDGALRFTTPGILDHNSAGNVVQDGVWQHVAVSFVPGAAGGARFYVNGAVVGTVNASALNRGNSAVWIGKNQWAGQVFNGELDEIAVYNRVLTDLEICELYFKAMGNTSELDATIAAITGPGAVVLTNVNFATDDGGFVAITPTPTGETDWAFTGTAWWSPGQAAASGGDNITYLTNGAPFLITRAGIASLSFTHRHSFEADWDGGVVQVSVNGGAFTTVPHTAFTANSYNGTLVGNTGTSLAAQRVFYGNSAGHPAYITSTCMLAEVKPGDAVVVQFVANYDNNTTGTGTPSGWEITNIQLTEGGGDALRVACPCGTLQRKVGSLDVPWADLGVSATLISTSQTNQQYFRVRP